MEAHATYPARLIKERINPLRLEQASLAFTVANRMCQKVIYNLNGSAVSN